LSITGSNNARSLWNPQHLLSVQIISVRSIIGTALVGIVSGGNGGNIYYAPGVTVTTFVLTGGIGATGGTGGNAATATGGAAGSGGLGVNGGVDGSAGIAGSASDSAGANGGNGSVGIDGSLIAL